MDNSKRKKIKHLETTRSTNLIDKIEAGLEDSERGNVYSTADVKKKLFKRFLAHKGRAVSF